MGTFPWRGDGPRPGDDTEDNGNEGTTHLTLSEEKVVRQVGGFPDGVPGERAGRNLESDFCSRTGMAASRMRVYESERLVDGGVK